MNVGETIAPPLFAQQKRDPRWRVGGGGQERRRSNAKYQTESDSLLPKGRSSNDVTWPAPTGYFSKYCNHAPHNHTIIPAPHHHYTTPSLHYTITTLHHHCTTPSLHYTITTPHHHYTTPSLHYTITTLHHHYTRASYEPPGPLSKSSAPTKAGSLSSGCRYSLVVGSMASFSSRSHEPFSARSRSSPLAISMGRENDTGSYVEHTLCWVEAGR